MSTTLTAQAGQTDLLAAFLVRDALCAVDAAAIHEVIRLGQVTPVRRAAPEITGIVNLRGKIVTVLDLGVRLGFPRIVPTGESRVFILEDQGEFVGLLVDRVHEVVEVDPARFEPAPANTPSAQARYFRGGCRSGGRLISLLDVQHMVESGQ